MMTFKKKNWPLLLGTLMLFLLLCIVLFPEFLTHKNPYALSMIKFWISDQGSLQMATAPYPPGPANLLGTDQIGRDLFSFLIYGCRLTLLLAVGITLFRFILALPIGVAAGMSNGTAHRIIDRFNLVFTTIPPLLVAIIVLRIDLFSSLYKAQSIAIFIVTLTLVGWSKVASVIEHSSAGIISETYILAERAIGKSERRIAFEHVLPHLRSEAIILFFMEIATALTLLMQLGLFSIFVGNLKIIRDSSQSGFSYFNVTFEPEWSSLLGSARDYIRVAPWIALSAGAIFFLTVLAFNLFGEGLRLHFQKAQQSRPVSLLSGFTLKWKIGLALCLILVVISNWPASYPLEQNYQSSTLLASNDSQGMSLEETQKWIEQELAALQLEKLDSGDYRQIFEKPDSFELISSDLSLHSESLSYGTDYILTGGTAGSGDGALLNATETFYQLDQTMVINKLIYIDTQLIPKDNVFAQLETLKSLGVKGVFINDGIAGSAPLDLPMPVYSLSAAQSEKIENLDPLQTLKVAYKLQGHSAQGDGINYFAKIGGAEPTMAHNTIILGMDYQAPTKERRAEKLAFYFNLIENLNAHKDQINRTIVFALFDGSSGLVHYSEHALVQNKNVNLYLDLTDIEYTNFSKISFSDALSPISRYYGFIFANQFKKNGKAMIDEKPAALDLWDQWLYQSEGLTTLNIQTTGVGKKKLSDLQELLVLTLLENTK